MQRRELLKLLVAAPLGVAASVLPLKGIASDQGIPLETTKPATTKRWLWFCNQCMRSKWTMVGSTPPPNIPCTVDSDCHRWEYIDDFEARFAESEATWSLRNDTPSAT